MSKQLDCEVLALTPGVHSRDRRTIYYGREQPYELCGYHAQHFLRAGGFRKMREAREAREATKEEQGS